MKIIPFAVPGRWRVITQPATAASFPCGRFLNSSADLTPRSQNFPAIRHGMRAGGQSRPVEIGDQSFLNTHARSGERESTSAMLSSNGPLLRTACSTCHSASRRCSLFPLRLFSAPIRASMARLARLSCGTRRARSSTLTNGASAGLHHNFRQRLLQAAHIAETHTQQERASSSCFKEQFQLEHATSIGFTLKPCRCGVFHNGRRMIEAHRPVVQQRRSECREIADFKKRAGIRD